MGKTRKDSEVSEVEEKTEKSWEEKTKDLIPIAKPLATKKLTKRLFKTVKKAAKNKNSVIKGVRDVQKAIRKQEKGFVLIAGDVTPMDVISHIPVYCEEHDIEYCYVPSKEDLGAAMGMKRQTCMVMVKSHKDYEENFNESLAGIKELPKPC